MSARDGRVEYRIDFTIQRRVAGDDDFSDVGFGSSGAWSSLNAASHAAASAIDNREWDTERGMPAPEDV